MDYLKIALSKGRLAEISLARFLDLGLAFPDYSPDSRKLVFINPEQNIKIVMVKAEDVSTYVERGAADLGIVGKDNLMEKQPDVYEIMDLKYGGCMFALASPRGSQPVLNRNIRVATKYPNVARDYFSRRGEAVEIVFLGGSVELAPVMGLADVIVDLVETGTTLKENGLEIMEEICQVSARLIANRVSFKAKSAPINMLVQQLQRSQRGRENLCASSI